MLPIKIKLTHPNSKFPVKTHETDAAFDVFALGFKYNVALNFVEYDLGFQLEIPTGYKAILAARSSLSNMDWIIPNGFGVIDCTYRGNLKIRFKNLYQKIDYDTAPPFLEGDRIGQIFFSKVFDIDFMQTTELSETVRGIGGFGSTGK